MRFLRSILLATALCSLAPVTPTQAQLKSRILGYRVEPVKVGDRFVYALAETRPGRKKQITKRTTLVERVVSIDAGYEDKYGARKLLRDTLTGESVYYLETPGVSFSMNEPSSLTTLRSAGKWKTYPLVIAKGKSIKLPESEQVIDLGSSRSSTTTQTSLSILGKEKLRVGNKSYTCIKVRETTTTESQMTVVTDTSGTAKHPRGKTTKETRVATLWYSPELQTLVKYTTSHGKQSFTQTLIRYIKALEQTAMLETQQGQAISR